jgi:protoporphyrinogen oxidase
VVRAFGRPGGSELELHAPVVVSTLPLPVAVGMLGDAAPPAVRDAADGLGHRAVVLVYLVLDQRRWTRFDAHYLPGPESIASRVSEPRNYREGDDPDGVTVLCAEVPCDVGDAVWEATDAQLGEQVARELSAMGLPTRPVEVVTRRLPAVYPVLRPGDGAVRGAVERWWSSRPGLLSAGRAGRHVGDNTHHVIAEGLAVGRLVGPGGRIDRSAWAAVRRQADAFVVED